MKPQLNDSLQTQLDAIYRCWFRVCVILQYQTGQLSIDSLAKVLR